MKAWKNLEFGIAGIRVDDPAYTPWARRESIRLQSDWLRDTSRINPIYLRPMRFYEHIVAHEIKQSKLMPSAEGGHGYWVADYVVGLDGSLRVGFSHTKLSEMTDTDGVMMVGMPVFAAGQIHYGGGIIEQVDNWSGHYKPNQQDLGRINYAFAKAGLTNLLARDAMSPDRSIAKGDIIGCGELISVPG
jgi:hypothetical protein